MRPTSNTLGSSSSPRGSFSAKVSPALWASGSRVRTLEDRRRVGDAGSGVEATARDVRDGWNLGRL